MFQAQPIAASEPRRGVILMIVLILLTLFAIVGLSFALYADAEAKSAQIYRESEIEIRPNVDPESLLSYFMGQLAYDTDDAAGVYSALRGHSLVRGIFGFNYTVVGSQIVPLNDYIPYNGTGRLHDTTNNPFATDLLAPPIVKDNYNLINYTTFLNNLGQLQDGFAIDPERVGYRTSLSLPTGAYFGFNAPYTYPDLNNMFLAAVKPDGTVLTQSFHRNWLFNPGTTLNDQTNPNWTNKYGKYLILRPRPADMGLGFPYPEDPGGDVKNLVGAPGGNDSIWIDLGFPVMQTPNGKKFKPLFAPLIMDLDSKVNLNVHGNIRGWLPYINPPNPPNPPATQLAHVSNAGFGPWSVNLGQVLNYVSAGQTYPTEWTQLFLPRTAPTVYGRYGVDQQPATAGSQAPFGPAGHFYSLTDFDECNELNGYVPTQAVIPLGASATGVASCFPATPPGIPFIAGTYPQGYGNSSAQELTNHPLLHNFFQPTGDDRQFLLSNMEALLRYGQTGSPFLTSELLRMCPNNFSSLALDQTIRNRVTLRSFDFDVPGVAPWIWNQTPATPYYTLTGLYPTGGPLNFAAPPTPPAPPTDYGADWRAVTAALGRLDLNRPLPNYPPPAAFDLATFQVAQTARVQLAQDIFRVLLLTTTGTDPSQLPGPPAPLPGVNPGYDAARWLAQLAVNIVDFIDTDDYITPFPWNPNNPNEYVFGTELPRVVINEALVTYTPPAGGTSTVNVWVELHNPFNTDNTLANNGDAVLAIPGATGYAIYQIALCQPDLTPTYYRRVDNVLGTPYSINPTDLKMTYPIPNPPAPGGSPGIPLLTGDAGVGTWPATAPLTIQASNGRLGGTPPPQVGYYVVGPAAIPGTGGPSPDCTVPSMSYTAPVTGMNPAPSAPTIMLQRLACPYLPPQPILPPPVTSPYYNPYITVDYWRNVDGIPTGMNAGLIVSQNSTTAPVPNMTSDERVQPYAGNIATKAFATTNSLGMNQPKCTLWAVNAPEATPPFSWLVHLDRPLKSPMELLHVSAFKPHELTQEFIDPATGSLQPFNHRVPWFDEDIPANPTPPPPTLTSHLLYRFFEFVMTRSRTAALQAPPVTTLGSPVTAPNNGTAVPVTVQNQVMSTTSASGLPIGIQSGSVLVIDTPPNQESVRVATVPPVTATSFTANFYKSHNAGVPILLTSTGDRVPGRINVNTIWDDVTDPRTFSALCDAQPSAPAPNNFLQADVTQIYTMLFNLRTPNGTPSSSDVPFWGSATGLYPGTDSQYPGYSINNTLFRSNTLSGAGNTARLFQVTNANATTPYNRYELLNKIFNNITTRSNVFAVWVTVGFFEVVDDTTRPVKLGAEIGRSENRNIRHRMFAIVDRTQLTVPSAITTLASAVASPGPQTVQVGSLTALIPPANAQVSQFPWTIQPNSYVVIDYGTTNQETVLVTGTAAGPPATIAADFTRPHSIGATVSVIVVPGNPGPQTRFNVHDPYYQAVVPYFSIIQ